LRRKGSDGGHNGLASIIYQLSTDEFPRLRIGIGADDLIDPVDFVLSKFTTAEHKELKTITEQAVAACKSFMADGILNTMNRYN
jgi:PTH1 family peptidyl-tRNA hydrolase